MRELQNVIERAVILSKKPALSVDVADLKFPRVRHSRNSVPLLNFRRSGVLHKILDETERRHILNALEQCNWVVAGSKDAAVRPGMKRSTLQLIRKLQVARPIV
jgi:formate hydrogenlyase transcriptional activator